MQSLVVCIYLQPLLESGNNRFNIILRIQMMTFVGPYYVTDTFLRAEVPIIILVLILCAG